MNGTEASTGGEWFAALAILAGVLALIPVGFWWDRRAARLALRSLTREPLELGVPCDARIAGRPCRVLFELRVKGRPGAAHPLVSADVAGTMKQGPRVTPFAQQRPITALLDQGKPRRHPADQAVTGAVPGMGGDQAVHGAAAMGFQAADRRVQLRRARRQLR